MKYRTPLLFSLFLLLGASVACAQSLPFEGDWIECGDRNEQGETPCSGFTLVQQGNRVCGEWLEWATHRSYEGKLTAVVSAPNQAEWENVCGKSDAAPCPTRKHPKQVWEHIDGRFQLCGDVLYAVEGSERSPASCSQLARSLGYTRKPLGLEARQSLLNQQWVRSCLQG